MPELPEYDESDPRHHTARLRERLEDVARSARTELADIHEPTAHRLVVTTADVCLALATTFEHYERRPWPVRAGARDGPP
jgi:hypothetical protein